MAEPASSDTGPISPGAVRAGHRRSTACAWWMRSGPKFLAKLHTTVKYTVDPIERAVLDSIRRDMYNLSKRYALWPLGGGLSSLIIIPIQPTKQHNKQ